MRGKHTLQSGHLAQCRRSVQFRVVTTHQCISFHLAASINDRSKTILSNYFNLFFFIFIPTTYSTVLLRITDELQKAMSDCLSPPFSLGVFVFPDLLAALDTINHSLSLQRFLSLASRQLLSAGCLFLFLISKCWCAQYGPSPQPSFFLYTLSLGDLIYCHVTVCAQSLQSGPILCDPLNYSLPGSSVHGILQEKIPEWVVMPSSRGTSRPRDRTSIS